MLPRFPPPRGGTSNPEALFYRIDTASPPCMLFSTLNRMFFGYCDPENSFFYDNANKYNPGWPDVINIPIEKEAPPIWKHFFYRNYTASPSCMLLPELNRMFFGYVDPENIFLYYENMQFPGWPVRYFGLIHLFCIIKKSVYRIQVSQKPVI